MRRLWLLFLLLPFLSSCEKKQAADDGHIVGNGGDYLENLFIQGKLQAIRVLQRFKATPFAELERDSTLGSRADLKVLYDRADELIPAIRNSKHEWAQKLPAGCPYSTCGCTLPNHPDTVFLSYDNCRETHTSGQAGSVLLHESTHAIMKSDEPTARQLTSVAYELWASWGHPDIPHWRHLVIPKELRGTLVSAIRIGEELVYVDDSLWRFHPGRESWTKVEVKRDGPKAFDDWENWFWSHNEGHALQGNVVIFGHCWKTRLTERSGLVFDPISGRESIMPTTNAPSSRYRTVQAVGDEQLFVWGGDECEEDQSKRGGPGFLTYRDGGIYSLKSGWTPVTEMGAPKFTRSARAAWSGNEFVVWDGKQPLHRYDPQLKKWLNPIPIGIEVKPEDWTMGTTDHGVLILTQREAIIYRGSKFETHEIGPPLRSIRLGSTDTHFGADSYFGSDFVTFFDRGLVQFDLKKLRWRFLAASPYSADAPMRLLFFTGAEYLIIPSQYTHATDNYGALFYP